MQHPPAIDPSASPLSTGLVWLKSRIEQFIASGGRAVVLVGPPGSGKVRLVDAVLSGLSGRQTRIGNLTSRPLSMKRMLQQIGMPSDEGTDGPFFGMLAEQAYDDQSAVVVVQQAHTLSPYALSALSRVPGLGGPEHPGMILVLAGEASLLAKLSAPGLEQLRNARRTLVLTMPAGGAVDEAGVARLTWTALLPDGGDAAAAASPGRRRLPPIRTDRPTTPAAPLLKRPAPQPAGLVMLGAAMTAAITLGWMVWPEPTSSRSPATTPVIPPPASRLTSEQPRPMLSGPGPIEAAAKPPGTSRVIPEPSAPVEETATLPSSSLAAPPLTPDLTPRLTTDFTPGPLPNRRPEPAPESAPEQAPEQAQEQAPEPAPEPTPAQIKREFDGFLNRAGRDTAKLTPAARAALFREYLQWRIRASLAGP